VDVRQEEEADRGRDRLIQTSHLSDVTQLIAALADDNADRREAAIARLRIAGARALARLETLIRSDGPPVAREGALEALEGCDDPRAAELALTALTDIDSRVATAAIGVLRTWLTREAQPTVLEALTEAALDAGRPDAVRLAALDALSELPKDLVRPVVQQAARDTPAARHLDEPSAVREWLTAHPRASLSDLHALVTAVGEHERREASARVIQEWAIMRGAVHAELARRGSRVALYDLRESFDGAQNPLPLDFLTAVAAIGDSSCLEPLARAWTAAPHETWWRSRLCEAADEIIRREQITSRSAVVKRLRAKYPGFLK
jgi:hypothetical protein